MAEAMRDPWAAFLEDQQLPVEQTATAPSSAHTEIAIGIAAGFLAYRTLVSKWLSESENAIAPNAFDLATKIAARYSGAWILFVAPAIARAYELGYLEAGTSLPVEVREQMAEEYTKNLGEYINQTSAEALLEGYQAQLVSGWNEKLAWQRSAAGYGLDKQQTRSWIGAQLQAPSSYQKDWITNAARKAVDKLFMSRANRLGDNEAYHASQVAKSLYWMYAQSSGKLPSDAMKQWSTARDERVCPVCAPLDGVAVPLTAQFEVGDVKMWAPGAHPRCRCNIYVYYPVAAPDNASELVDELSPLAKNMPGDPYDRDVEGRFARKEERKSKPVRFKEPEQAQEIADLVKPVVENPFETTKNPFGVQNPFVAQNPFAQEVKNPFAQEAKNPFSETKNPFIEDPFAENPFVPRIGKKRIIRRIVLIGNQPTIQEEVVDVEDLDFYQDTVYLNGDKFMDDYFESSYDDPTIPGIIFAPGEHINFDMLSIPEPSTKTSRMPNSAMGFYDNKNDWKAFRHVVENEVPEYIAWAKNHGRRQSSSLMNSYISDSIEYQLDEMFSDPEYTLRGLGRSELTELARKAVEKGQDPTKIGYFVHTDNPYHGISNEAIAHYLANEIKNAKPGSPIHDAAYELFHDLALENNPELEIFDRDTTIGEDQIPTVFKLEGWYGGHYARPQVRGVGEVILEGDYVIKDVKYLRLTGEDRKDTAGDLLPFDQLRIVTMRPRSAT